MASFTEYDLTNLLRQFGIPVGPFQSLINQAVTNAWSWAQFEGAVYGSNAFANMFPGIFKADGSLRMSPAEYRSMSQSYIGTARQYGLNLNPSQIGKLIGSDVSLQEFADRATAIQRVTEFKPAFEQFKQALRARGISTAGLDSDKDIANFILGKGPKQFYKIWEETNIGTAAHLAGIGIGGQMTKSIARRTPGVLTEAQYQEHFKNLAQNLKTVMPMSRIQKLGISKRDLITLEFGGKGQDEIAQKVQRVMRNDQAFNELERSRTGRPLELGRQFQSQAQSL